MDNKMRPMTPVQREPSILLLVGLTLITGVAIDWMRELYWHDQHRIEQIALLFVVAVILSCGPRGVIAGLVRFGLGARVALALAFGLGMLSVALSAYPRFSALEWLTFLLFTASALMLAHEASRHPDRFDHWVLVLLGWVGGIIVLKIMTGYVAALAEGVRLDAALLFEGTFSNRRFFGQVASMIIPLLAIPFLRSGVSRVRRWAWFALLAVWWMLLLVSGTRGSWLALAVSAFALLFWARRSAWGWVRVQSLGLGAGALAFAILFVIVPRWLGVDVGVENRLNNLATLSGREVIWGLAWDQIIQHPWLGIGPMHLASIRNAVAAHPHNSILQAAAEWGVPAALAWLAVVLAGMTSFLTPLRQLSQNNHLRVSIASALLAASMQSLVDGVIVIPYTQLWLVLIIGWALGLHWRDQVFVGTAPWPQIWAARVAGLIAGGGLAWSVYPEILNRVEITSAYLDHYSFLPPRYWVVGWIP